MGTKNPKLQGYIKPQIYKVYEQFKRDKGIESDSQVLNVILSEFLGLNGSPSEKNISDYQPNLIDRKIEAAIAPILRRLEHLEYPYKQFTGHLESNLSTTENSLLYNIPSNPESNLDIFQGNLPSDSSSNPESNLETDSTTLPVPDLAALGYFSLGHSIAVDTGNDLTQNTQNEDKRQIEQLTLISDADETVKRQDDIDRDELDPKPQIEAKDSTFIDTMTRSDMARYLVTSKSNVSNWVKKGQSHKFPKDWTWNHVRDEFERVKL